MSKKLSFGLQLNDRKCYTCVWNFCACECKYGRGKKGKIPRFCFSPVLVKYIFNVFWGDMSLLDFPTPHTHRKTGIAFERFILKTCFMYSLYTQV